MPRNLMPTSPMTVRALLLALAGAIALVSLEPFDFQLWPLGPNALDEPLHRLRINPFWQPRADIAANVLAFVPVGLLSALRRRGDWAALGAALCGWLAFAVALQLCQLYLPSRVPSLGDAAWNGLGLAIGAACGVAAAARSWPGLPLGPGRRAGGAGGLDGAV